MKTMYCLVVIEKPFYLHFFEILERNIIQHIIFPL
jgi:hypothetical protein